MYDVNGDGRLEILIGGDQTAGGYINWAGGELRASGVEPGTGARDLEAPVDDDVWSSPAVGDIDGDGRVEAVVGGGNYYNRGRRPQVWAWHVDDGPRGQRLADPHRRLDDVGARMEALKLIHDRHSSLASVEAAVQKADQEHSKLRMAGIMALREAGDVLAPEQYSQRRESHASGQVARSTQPGSSVEPAESERLAPH